MSEDPKPATLAASKGHWYPLRNMAVASFPMSGKYSDRKSRSSRLRHRSKRSGDDLLVGSGEVPAKLGRGQPKLGFGEVLPDGADLESQSVGAELALGIDRGAVDSGRAARAEDDVDGVEQDITGAGPVEPAEVQGQGAMTLRPGRGRATAAR